MVADVWTWFTTVHTPLVGWIIVVAVVTGVIAAVWRPLWVLSSYVSTWVHEAGHAVAGVLTGARVSAVRVKFDRSGCTDTAGGWFSNFVSAGAGYTAPSVVGALMLVGVLSGRYQWVVLVGVVVVFLLLPLQRSFLGWVYGGLLAAGAVMLMVVSPEVAQFGLCAVGGFLLTAGFRDLAALSSARTKDRVEKVKWSARSTDADVLAKLTLVPAVVWELWFGVVAVASVALVVWVMFWVSPVVLG